MLPSGSRNAAKWQTPESCLSHELDATRLELRSSRANIGHTYRESSRVRHERQTIALRLPEAEGDVAGWSPLGHLALGKPKDVAVPRLSRETLRVEIR